MEKFTEKATYKDDVQRIYEKFDDLNDFAGYTTKRDYGREYLKEFEEQGMDDDMLDKINALRTDATEAAFLDGFRFGLRFLVQGVMKDLEVTVQGEDQPETAAAGTGA